MDELNYTDIWKYLEDRANKLKDRAVTLSTWLLGLATAMIAFAADKTIRVGADGATVNAPELVLLIGVLGLGLVWYVVKMLKNYGLHLERNFKRADRARQQIGTLDEIWDAGKDITEEGLKLSEPLSIVATAAYALGTGFAALLVLGVVLIVTGGCK